MAAEAETLLDQNRVRRLVTTTHRALLALSAATGGVLLLPNHVSYVDALIVGSASRRPVRFVMWDALYHLWWLKWLMRLIGTVPISATRAKDAIRAVAADLAVAAVILAAAVADL